MICNGVRRLTELRDGDKCLWNEHMKGRGVKNISVIYGGGREAQLKKNKIPVVGLSSKRTGITLEERRPNPMSSEH